MKEHVRTTIKGRKLKHIFFKQTLLLLPHSEGSEPGP